MALILSRRKNEGVVIQTPYGPVRVFVTEISWRRVKLGFEAPAEIRIMREELLEQGAQPEPGACVVGG